jgi:two-component system response regulator FixJ
VSARHLYIVDDDDVVRASLSGLMSTQPGLHIRDFPSGDHFLAAREGLEPGCLLLDLHMPGTRGMDVLQTVAQHPGRFAVIILTGQGDIPAVVQAMSIGAVNFLEKPCDHRALIAAVDKGFAQLQQQQEERTSREEARAKLDLLSGRELDVLHGLIEGLPNKLIAHQLEISPRTVEIYRANLMEKLGVRSLSEALRITFAAGLDPR